MRETALKPQQPHGNGSQNARLTMTVLEAAGVLGLSKGAAYEAAKTGAIPTLRIGRRILVPRAALERLLSSAGGNVS